MSKVKKGLAAEHIVKAKFLLEGFNVYEEVNYDSKCDLIVETNNQCYRLQIKVTNSNNELTFRKLTHSKTQHKQHHYSCLDVDYFVGVDVNTFDLYILPITKITRSSKKTHLLEEYKNNFNLEPCCGNAVSADPQVGEAFDNGNTELGVKPSVETLRDPSKDLNIYDEDKVQTTNN